MKNINAIAITNNERIADCFCNLYLRWQDEKGYENIEDYGKAMFNSVIYEFPKLAISYVNVNYRKFGIRVKMDGHDWDIVVQPQDGFLTFGMLPADIND